MDSQETVKRKNGFAIAGFVLGLLSIISASIGIVPLMAIIFSSIGLSKAKALGGKGNSIASVGLALGIIFMIANLYINGHLG